MVNLPTELLVKGASSTGTQSSAPTPTGTQGATVGREAGILGVVVGGFMAGLAVL